MNGRHVDILTGAIMPEAVIFHYQGKIRTAHFARPKAMLPIRMVGGEVKLITWGRRKQENSEMPLGGWARHDAIQEGSWSQYSPKPVLLPIKKFMKTDFEGAVHWYDVISGQWLQGLVAQIDSEYRVYIVTVIPTLLDIAHDRWPRIIVR